MAKWVLLSPCSVVGIKQKVTHLCQDSPAPTWWYALSSIFTRWSLVSEQAEMNEKKGTAFRFNNRREGNEKEIEERQ